MLQRKTMGGSFLPAVRTIVIFRFTVAVQAFVVIHGILIFYGVAVQTIVSCKTIKNFHSEL
jgi:hypothetical protein